MTCSPHRTAAIAPPKLAVRRRLPAGAAIVAALVVSSAFTPPLAAWDLAGSVELVAAGEGPAAADVAEAVVLFTPAGGRPTTSPGTFEIVMARKQFQPRVLVAPAGSSVRFPNRDPILHNVFSVSGENAFDLGLYRNGDGKEVTFREPGLVRIFCNVHHDMVAYVLVVATPFLARPERGSGAFRLTGLPAGAGTVTAWHERAEAWSAPVSDAAAGPLSVRLELSLPRVPRHRNKLGQPYSREPAEGYIPPP